MNSSRAVFALPALTLQTLVVAAVPLAASLPTSCAQADDVIARTAPSLQAPEPEALTEPQPIPEPQTLTGPQPMPEPQQEVSCLLSCGGNECPCSNTPQIVVPSGDYSIDATEVTITEYQRFLSSGTTPSTGPQAHASFCEWNTSFVPTESSVEVDPRCYTDFDFEGWLVTDPQRPVVCVDWCDAAAYCEWQGGRLCQRTDGGLIEGSEGDAPNSEWYLACSLAGAQAYSYGNDFDAMQCNVQGSGHNGYSIPVASLPSCEGPLDGLFDMTGNVDEWVAWCDEYSVDEPEMDGCYRVGGGFFQGEASLSRCDAGLWGQRGLLGNNTGFRCCYDG